MENKLSFRQSVGVKLLSTLIKIWTCSELTRVDDNWYMVKLERELQLSSTLILIWPRLFATHIFCLKLSHATCLQLELYCVNQAHNSPTLSSYRYFWKRIYYVGILPMIKKYRSVLDRGIHKARFDSTVR
jgi:hypothetical protein